MVLLAQVTSVEVEAKVREAALNVSSSSLDKTEDADANAPAMDLIPPCNRFAI